MSNKETITSEITQKKLELLWLERALADEEAELNKNHRYTQVCEEREKVRKELKKAPIPTSPFPTFGIVVAVIIIIISFFKTFALFLVGAVALIFFATIRSMSIKKQKAKIDKIYDPIQVQFNALTREYNEMRSSRPKIEKIQKEITDTQKALDTLEKQLKAIIDEEESIKRAENHAREVLKRVAGSDDPSLFKNHVFIHVGRKSLNIKGAGVIKHELYIDGQCYSAAPFPFATFEMNPGVHTLIVNYAVADSIYRVNPIQFRVEEKSQFIAFKYVHYNFEITRFDDFASFLTYIETTYN